MHKFIHNLRQILPQVHNSHLPSLIFGAALLGFYLYGNISTASMQTLHICFFLLNIISAGILIYFNQRKPLLYLLVILFSYILINHFKRQYSLDYLSSPAYINLCFFAPLNLAVFFFWPNTLLLTRRTVYWLLFIFAEYALAEKLTASSLTIALNLSADSINLNSLSILLFSLLILTTFWKAVNTGSIMDCALFFAGLNIFAGFYYSSSSTALSIFYCAAATTCCIAIIKDIYHTTYTDITTGLPGRYAYHHQAPSFPLKYSLGIICIDNYTHLRKIFKKKGINAITKMIAMRLSEVENENPIFRYSENEFIVIFKNEGKKESFERLENIRRSVASAEFMLEKGKKGLKLTISCCVSEKKRSDDNSLEVLERARKALQKAYQFTQNITSKA